MTRSGGTVMLLRTCAAVLVSRGVTWSRCLLSRVSHS
jgi:hypothetical protein